MKTNVLVPQNTTDNLWGQWLGKLDPPNVGQLKLDIDEGAAFGSLDVMQTISGNQVNLQGKVLFPSGQSRAPARIDLVQIYPPTPSGQQAPRANGEVRLTAVSAGTITGSWHDDNGEVRGTFRAERADTCPPSPAEHVFSSWREFKEWVDAERDAHPNRVFRGQSDNSWPLTAHFFRQGRRNVATFADTDVHELNLVFTDAAKRTFNIDDSREFGALLHLAQHHGYPTPLLDWTMSPYIAAFFAYQNLRPKDTHGYVRVFALEAQDWATSMGPVFSLTTPGPYFAVHRFLPIANNRSIPQQSVVTSTNLAQVEPWIKGKEAALNRRFLIRVDLPQWCRAEVVKDLAFMGISAATMRPGLDGACAALRERNFGY